MALVLCLFLAGCGKKMTSVEDINNSKNASESMFVKVEQGDSYRIVYHRGTKVMYVISNRPGNNGTFTVMLDANGKPLLYQED
jgi:hypothetical protein